MRIRYSPLFMVKLSRKCAIILLRMRICLFQSIRLLMTGDNLVEADLTTFVDEVTDQTKLLRHYSKAGYGSKDFPAKVNLVGHSMGGLIIAGYLQTAGNRRSKK